MAGIYLICGKICSGKSYYAKILKEKMNAVILSTDEVTYALINNEQGEFYNIFAQRVNDYLKKKAVEICKAGANVILDWGFWTRKEREEISAFISGFDVDYEWHYIDVSEDDWERNIDERNIRIQNGLGGSDFYVDDGLRRKVISLFEIPQKDEIDIWYRPRRVIV